MFNSSSFYLSLFFLYFTLSNKRNQAIPLTLYLEISLAQYSNLSLASSASHNIVDNFTELCYHITRIPCPLVSSPYCFTSFWAFVNCVLPDFYQQSTQWFRLSLRWFSISCSCFSCLSETSLVAHVKYIFQLTVCSRRSKLRVFSCSSKIFQPLPIPKP